MASVSMASPLTSAKLDQPIAEAFYEPTPMRLTKRVGLAKPKPKPKSRLEAQASLKERAVTGLTAAAMTASIMIPEVAAAAESGVSPSLKNFLLSIVAGGVVVAVLVGAVIGVANFDPVKRS